MADAVMATGRRKTSIAVVKLVKGKGRIFVNGKTLRDYIGNRPAVEMMLYRPLVLTENQEKYDASTIETKNAERTRDIELSRLQTFTDNYCSCQRQSMLISIFAD